MKLNKGWSTGLRDEQKRNTGHARCRWSSGQL